MALSTDGWIPQRGSESLLLLSTDDRSYKSTSTKGESASSSWKLPLADYVSKKQGSKVNLLKSKRLRSYYKIQDQLIEAYESVSEHVEESFTDSNDIRQTRLALRYSEITFAINIMLMAAKAAASYLSGSLSVISSLLDSVLDVSSGLMMWLANRSIQTRDPYKYPHGKKKLEPVAVVVLSVVMSMASVEFVRESVTKMLALVKDPSDLPTVHLPVVVIAASTVVVKFVLWLVCRRVHNNTVQTLALDHRNDVMSNVVAIVCGYLGSRQFQAVSGLPGFIYVDPGGGIVISLYIIVTWCRLAYEHTLYLTGVTADRMFLSKVTWMALNHDRRVLQVDTVRACHYGNRLLVDVDVVLAKVTALETSHDVGERLQRRLEGMDEVERAYVHVDHESRHNPLSEHRAG